MGSGQFCFLYAWASHMSSLGVLTSGWHWGDYILERSFYGFKNTCYEHQGRPCRVHTTVLVQPVARAMRVRSGDRAHFSMGWEQLSSQASLLYYRHLQTAPTFQERLSANRQLNYIRNVYMFCDYRWPHFKSNIPNNWHLYFSFYRI